MRGTVPTLLEFLLTQRQDGWTLKEDQACPLPSSPPPPSRRAHTPRTPGHDQTALGHRPQEELITPPSSQWPGTPGSGCLTPGGILAAFQRWKAGRRSHTGSHTGCPQLPDCVLLRPALPLDLQDPVDPRVAFPAQRSPSGLGLSAGEASRSHARCLDFPKL